MRCTNFLDMNYLKSVYLLFAFLSIAWSYVTAQDEEKSFRKPNNGNVYVIAHRGAHKGIPENTLAAYQKAIDLGCDFVEIDVRKTRDGRFVSVHNEEVDKYTGGEYTGKVKSFTLEELKNMNIGKSVGPEWKNERIPTLEEILKLCEGKIGIYLDLKEPYMEELAFIIKGFNMVREVVWYIPFSKLKEIKELKKYCPNCIVMPDPGSGENINKVAESVETEVIATDMSHLNEDFVKTAHEFNMKIFVDEDKGGAEEWTKIISWGTDGIQTDDPEALVNFLKSGKHKH